jgi:predicted nucleic acid-binding protein
MIILDTNVISELMKTQKSAIVREWVAAQPLMSLFTTTITQAEILYGIALLPEGKRREELSQNAAVAFAHIASRRRQNGTPISQPDAQIAAICYTHKATVATRNVTDFEGCGISIINPWKPESIY